MAELIISIIALAASLVAVALAAVAHRRAGQPKQVGPTRDEMIAFHRGNIQAARAMEETLGDADEIQARILLALARDKAAHAREHLRALGIEQ